jgi:hypothetical protein
LLGNPLDCGDPVTLNNLAMLDARGAQVNSSCD